MSSNGNQSEASGVELSEIDFDDIESTRPLVPAKDDEGSSAKKSPSTLIDEAKTCQRSVSLQSRPDLLQELKDSTEVMSSLVDDPSNDSWVAFEEYIKQIYQRAQSG